MVCGLEVVCGLGVVCALGVVCGGDASESVLAEWISISVDFSQTSLDIVVSVADFDISAVVVVVVVSGKCNCDFRLFFDDDMSSLQSLDEETSVWSLRGFELIFLDLSSVDKEWVATRETG